MKKIVVSFVFFGTLALATNAFPKPAFDGPYPAPGGGPAPLPTPVPQVHANVK